MFGIRKKTDEQGAEVVSDPEVSKGVRQRSLVVYHAKDGWRWRLWSTNGHVVADSGEAYGRRFDCVQAAERLAATAANAKIVVADRKK